MTDKKRRVLVMDDIESVRRAVRRMLSREFEVVTVSDRFDAVNAYATARTNGEPFDLVLLDMQGIHEKDEGKIAVHQLLKIDMRVRAILYSSAVAHLSANEIRSFGFVGAIEKAPCPANEFLSRVRSFL